ncbi:MAG: RES domain-containing protein [Candidatus Nanopelagicales bacterium]
MADCRRDDPLRFARISQTDATLARAGNRFDVPGGGVLYAASTAEGCFAETLARFRPSPAVAAAVREDPGYMDPGGIPAAWREDRRLVSFALAAPLPFVDIDSTSTLLALGAQLHAELAPLGADELDRGGVYSANRRLTRILASWISPAPMTTVNLATEASATNPAWGGNGNAGPSSTAPSSPRRLRTRSTGGPRPGAIADQFGLTSH